MDETKDRSPPEAATAGEIDASTRDLIDRTLGVKGKASEHGISPDDDLIQHTLNSGQIVQSKYSTQDLIDHVIGRKRLPRAETTQSGGSSHRSYDSGDAEWERKRHEELERLKNVKLSHVGIANEAPLDADHRSEANVNDGEPKRGPRQTRSPPTLRR